MHQEHTTAYVQEESKNVLGSKDAFTNAGYIEQRIFYGICFRTRYKIEEMD
jgi:hypothetical protein